jgi:hypothetical protein
VNALSLLYDLQGSCPRDVNLGPVRCAEAYGGLLDLAPVLGCCAEVVLRLIRDRLASVSVRTRILNVGFPTGFRFRNSGGIGLQKSLTLLTTPCVITLQVLKGCQVPKSALICAHSYACCCCCCWCLCSSCCLSCCLWCCLTAWNSAKSDVAPDSGVADGEATCPRRLNVFLCER